MVGARRTQPGLYQLSRRGTGDSLGAACRPALRDWLFMEFDVYLPSWREFASLAREPMRQRP